MQDQNEARAEARIRALKDRIARLGPMRPGLLTVQYKDPARRRGAYRQISYTFQRRSRSDYVRPDDLPRIRAEVEQKKEIIQAYAVREGRLIPFTMRLGELTDDERQIILDGCLINYNRVK